MTEERAEDRTKPLQNQKKGLPRENKSKKEERTKKVGSAKREGSQETGTRWEGGENMLY